MPVSAAKLKKLRNRSFYELWTRGKQETAKLAERLPGVFFPPEISNRAWVAELHPESRTASAETSAAFILQRIRTSTAKTFFPSLGRRREIVELVDSRFPAERLRLIARADRVCSGRFDLLGLSDLSFGDPIDWRLEPLSGRRTPLVHWSQIDFLNPEVAGDKKVTWELNRHQFLVTLGQAYWLTGDERYAATCVQLISSWMDTNPPKLGINWASSLEVALRVTSWLWALYLLADSGVLTQFFILRLFKFLLISGRHIETYLSQYFAPNTHLTGEALGLFYLGTALPELKRSEHWRKLGMRILSDQLPIHVRPDGVYFEQSSYYHRYTTDFYIHLLLLAHASGTSLPESLEEKLKLLLDHLMWITRPDGSSPFYGDDDGGRLITLSERQADDFRDTLATGAALFKRADWKFVAGSAAVETLWLLGPDGLASYENLKPESPVECNRAFVEGGYFVMRDGWERESTYALVKCGPHGAMNCGHAHADALSFEFARGCVNWIVDPGSYTYTADKNARDEFRLSSAHNTVTVDGASQSVPKGTFAWDHIAVSSVLLWSIADDRVLFVGRQNGYARFADPVCHERSICLHKSEPFRNEPAYLIVCDTLDARGHHRYRLHFHFSSECRASAEGHEVRVVSAAGHELILATYTTIERVGVVRAPVRIEQGWVSRAYAQRQRAPVAVMEIEGRGAQRFTTIIFPVSDSLHVAEFLERVLMREFGTGITTLRHGESGRGQAGVSEIACSRQ